MTSYNMNKLMLTGQSWTVDPILMSQMSASDQGLRTKSYKQILQSLTP